MDSQVACSSIIANKRRVLLQQCEISALMHLFVKVYSLSFLFILLFCTLSCMIQQKKKEKKNLQALKRLKATNFMNVVLVDSSFQNKATVCVKWSKPRNPESNSFQRWESRYIFVRLSGAECFFSHVFSSFVEWGLLWRYKSLAVRAYPGATRRENEIQSSGRGLYLNRPSVLCS